jgi:hypothetical protein
MITQTPWIERIFHFEFPVGYFPVFLERLRGTAPRLEAMTRSLAPQVLSSRLEGKWSILEQIGHLSDLDELHDGRVDDFLENKPVLRAADMQNKMTEAANHNARSLEEILLGFRSRRGDFVDRLAGIDESLASRSALHPRLKQAMRLVDMVFFVAEHDDHHIARIRELITRQS